MDDTKKPTQVEVNKVKANEALKKEQLKKLTPVTAISTSALAKGVDPEGVATPGEFGAVIAVQEKTIAEMRDQLVKAGEANIGLTKQLENVSAVNNKLQTTIVIQACKLAEHG